MEIEFVAMRRIAYALHSEGSSLFQKTFDQPIKMLRRPYFMAAILEVRNSSPKTVKCHSRVSFEFIGLTISITKLYWIMNTKNFEMD